MQHTNSPEQATILGWDIGGVNTKAVRLGSLRGLCTPCELQRDPGALLPTLLGLARRLGHERGEPHAVTMTAELSQAFRTKREGVGFVLDAMEAAFPGELVRVYTVGGRFLDPSEARESPLEVAASNWAATARLVAGFAPDCILIDIGTTSTDIIPISGGEIAALGRTDPERLSSGELVYTGALRTPAESVVREVPLWGGRSAVAADGFAVIGDAHVWLGGLRVEDYSITAPDGRPPTREYAGERLARVVCGDREMLDEEAIDAIAQALVEAQLEAVTGAIGRVRVRFPSIDTAVVTGLGDFIAAEAARRARLTVLPLAERLGDAARTAPAAAVAWLLATEPAGRPA